MDPPAGASESRLPMGRKRVEHQGNLPPRPRVNPMFGSPDASDDKTPGSVLATPSGLACANITS